MQFIIPIFPTLVFLASVFYVIVSHTDRKKRPFIEHYRNETTYDKTLSRTGGSVWLLLWAVLMIGAWNAYVINPIFPASSKTEVVNNDECKPGGGMFIPNPC